MEIIKGAELGFEHKNASVESEMPSVSCTMAIAGHKLWQLCSVIYHHDNV